MKNSKLILLALLPLALSVAKLQAYCENEPSFLSIVSNKSQYNVLADSEIIPSLKDKNFGTSKAIRSGEIVIQQQMIDAQGRVAYINAFTLRDTGNGLSILKDGNTLTLGSDALHGCNMYIEIYYNANNSAGLILRAGSDGHVIAKTGVTP